MEYFLGLASGIALFALLVYVYHLGTQNNKSIKQAAIPPTEDEQRKIEQQKKGFEEMMNYNVEKARGSRSE